MRGPTTNEFTEILQRQSDLALVEYTFINNEGKICLYESKQIIKLKNSISYVFSDRDSLSVLLPDRT